jgi:hypothetical protein
MYLSFRPSRTTGSSKAVEMFGADPIIEANDITNLFGLPTVGVGRCRLSLSNPR